MIRHAFVMSVFPEKTEEYIRRHNPIWPELEETLKGHGVSNYSIFLDRETHQLFGYVELESLEQWAAIAETEVAQRWWRHMQPLMPTNDDASPVTRELERVFHVD